MPGWNDGVEYIMVVTVWGQEYVSRFLSCILPSWMAPGNIPAMAELKPKIIFYTDARSIPLFKANKTVTAAGKIGTLEYQEIEQFYKTQPSLRAQPMELMSACENHALEQSRHNVGKIGYFFMHSDLLFADGGLATIVHHIKNGKRAVMGTSLRVADGAIRQELTAYETNDKDGAPILVIPSRQLVEHSLKHLHQLERARTHGESIKTRDLSRVYWRLPDGGLYGPTMEMHPFFCRPGRFSLITDYHGNFDGAYVDYAFASTFGLNEDEFAFIVDSDDLFNIGIEAPDKFASAIHQGSLSVADMEARMLDGWAGPFQLKLLEKLRVSFHVEDMPNTHAIDAEIDRFLLAAFFLTLEKLAASRIALGLRPLNLDMGGVVVLRHGRLIQWALNTRKVIASLNRLRHHLYDKTGYVFTRSKKVLKTSSEFAFAFIVKRGV